MIQVLVAEKCQLLMTKKCQSPKNVWLFNILRLFLMVKIVGMQIEGICTCLRGADGGRSGGADVAIEVATMQNWPSLVLPVVSPLLLSLSCDYKKTEATKKILVTTRVCCLSQICKSVCEKTGISSR
jgi:hypothetical protein